MEFDVKCFLNPKTIWLWSGQELFAPFIIVILFWKSATDTAHHLSL